MFEYTFGSMNLHVYKDLNKELLPFDEYTISSMNLTKNLNNELLPFDEYTFGSVNFNESLNNELFPFEFVADSNEIYLR